MARPARSPHCPTNLVPKRMRVNIKRQVRFSKDATVFVAHLSISLDSTPILPPNNWRLFLTLLFLPVGFHIFRFREYLWLYLAVWYSTNEPTVSLNTHR
ncbi:hypothetical protein CCACVL1_26902 [Corchorus capsularis]|uniref:Uncharacterized protein n=1 Tax=Corchorus capsularis TaxID=210143 RepID=A0A1R3GCV3_COCAP|nr:hypothetical protein CCACVL1_26902 [Corchorus capsularis]